MSELGGLGEKRRTLWLTVSKVSKDTFITQADTSVRKV